MCSRIPFKDTNKPVPRVPPNNLKPSTAGAAVLPAVLYSNTQLTRAHPGGGSNFIRQKDKCDSMGGTDDIRHCIRQTEHLHGGMNVILYVPPVSAASRRLSVLLLRVGAAGLR